MKKLALFGNTNFTKIIKYYCENDWNRKIDLITVDRKYIDKGIKFDNVDVIAFEDFILNYDRDNYEFLVCIGYNKMNIIRQDIYNRLKKNGISVTSFIHSSSQISKNVIIGEGNIILENVCIQPFVKIGNSNLIWHGVNIAHDVKVGNFNTICSNSSINGFVSLENNIFIGSNSVIRDHINISNFTLIGAGTYLDKSTNENDVYVPNKAIKLDVVSKNINL